MANDKKTETNSSYSCSQAAIDLLESVSPIKEGMLKEVKCKGCGKTFLTNFDTEYCYNCRKNQKEA
jgi:uncharacterized OB-fold protein